MAEPMKVVVITPDATPVSGTATFLAGRAVDGTFGILPNHAPMIVALDVAPIRLDTPEGRIELAVFGGFCDIKNNTVTIVTPDCQRGVDIDVARAERAKQRAEERLASHDEHVDMKRAKHALARALLRLDIASRT